MLFRDWHKIVMIAGVVMGLAASGCGSNPAGPDGAAGAANGDASAQGADAAAPGEVPDGGPPGSNGRTVADAGGGPDGPAGPTDAGAEASDGAGASDDTGVGATDAGVGPANGSGAGADDGGGGDLDAGTPATDAGHDNAGDGGGTGADAGIADADAAVEIPDAGAATPDAGTVIPDAGTATADAGTGTGPITDGDLDGLDDAYETDIAARYRPFISLDPQDGCNRSVIAFRLRPHPAGLPRLHIIYVVLYERDCGLNGHAGDNEAFGVTVDPTIPPPAGILAIRAVPHQGTLCDKPTECGQCNLKPCETQAKAGTPWPVLYHSKGKHGGYVFIDECKNACFFSDRCTLNAQDHEAPLVNAGEPGHPLANDLTAAGLITTATGWTETSLLNYELWGGKEFGTAGVVADDFTDPAFDTPDPGCCGPACP